MEKNITQLQPDRLWYYFSEIAKVPRPSKKEEKIAAYLMDFGKSHDLETLRDEVGNVLIRKPGTSGRENDPIVILQSHIDMVCEKNSDVEFDFEQDAIQPYIDGAWVKAKGTTLGADDGIGIAAQLAILESKEISHGPIECLFTIDEETGLTGAFGLKDDLLKGRILLNLDSEDEGQIFIGCAGGRDTVATFDLEKEPVEPGSVAYKVSVTGLKGGHSGDDINKGLGNAVKILNRLLWNASEEFFLRIADIDAGNLRNAIAREGFATVTLLKERQQEFEQYLNEFSHDVKEELKSTEPGLTITAEPCPLPDGVIVPDVEYWLLHSLYACPHGVIEYSRDIPNFVETSTNLASVKIKEDQIVVTTSQRSSVTSAMKDVCDMVACVFYLAGADIEQSSGYPGWKPDPTSQILKLTVESYKDLFKTDPQVLAIHAGLECGLVGAIYPGMDMVSFGPTIKGAHSPDERLEIESAQKFWDLLLEILKRVK